MPFRRPCAAFALAAATLLGPGAATAGCLAAGTQASCGVGEDAPSRPELAMSSASAPTPLASVGDVLPRGTYSLVLNAEYYGLPPVADGWVYMRVGQDAYRVDWQSHQVLERVTEQAAANW